MRVIPKAQSPPDKLPYPTKKAVNAPLGESDFFRRPCVLNNRANTRGIISTGIPSFGKLKGFGDCDRDAHS